jgi:hypothetical protein
MTDPIAPAVDAIKKVPDDITGKNGLYGFIIGIIVIYIIVLLIMHGYNFYNLQMLTKEQKEYDALTGGTPHTYSEMKDHLVNNYNYDVSINGYLNPSAVWSNGKLVTDARAKLKNASAGVAKS